jgi:hypothetical protein
MSDTTTKQGRFRTGEQCELTGQYDFDGYLDGSQTPTPHPKEQAVAFRIGETFPPIRSAGKPCWWKSPS